jgi:hypothetical protein
MWKTRKMRRAMREQAPTGRVTEGEVVVVKEKLQATNNVLPERRPDE